MSANISVLSLFLWCCLVAFMLPYVDVGQSLWLFFATVVHVFYTGIKVSDLYGKGGEL
jgi:hypothetical protein